MDGQTDNVPSHEEVRAQLRRILSSADFKQTPKRAELLTYLVEKALDNEELKESIIGHDVVPNWSARRPPRAGHPDSELPSNVRVMATLLRDRLDDYYSGCGKNDPVLIKVERGEGYKVTRSYIRDPSAVALYNGGLAKRSAGTPLGFYDAMVAFIGATEKEPDYGPAHIAASEAALLLALCYVSESRIVGHNPPFKTIPDYLRIARAHANHAIRVGWRLWKAHLVLGFLNACCGKRSEADNECELALADSSPEVFRDPLFASYVLATGDEDKALEIVNAFVSDRSTEAYAHAICALFLYAMRRRSDASAAIRQAMALDRNNWLAEIVLALVLLHKDFMLFSSPDWARSCVGWADIGLRHATHFAPESTYFDGLLLMAQDDDERGTVDMEGRWLPGNIGDNGEEPGLFSEVLKSLSIGQYGEAAALVARSEGEPWLIWAHLWPLLDPLRQEPEFQLLVKRLQLRS